MSLAFSSFIPHSALHQRAVTISTPIRCRKKSPVYRHVAPTCHLHDSQSPQGDFIPLSPIHAHSHPFSARSEAADDSTVAIDSGSGTGEIPPDSGNRGGSGGRGSSDESSDSDSSQPRDDASLSTVLSEHKASINDFPPEVLSAYRANLIPLSAMSNYLIARANPLSRIMLPIGPMRDRFLADRLFLLKILIEEGIGLCGKLSAEYQQRRSNFWKEGEFVTANLIMALLADFALVFFPAPSVSLAGPSKVTQTGIRAWFSKLSANLPSNIFQTDRPFTLAQRAGGYALKASQLFAVGFLCCFTGVMLTNTLVYIRERVDSSYNSKTAKQNPLVMSSLYAIFLGLSSGTRYQLVNGVESHIFPRLFAKAPAIVEQCATFGLRYANTFWGSQQWVMFARFTNVQKRASEPLEDVLTQD